jgi:molecular chaperone DnaK (HSP70)
LFYHLGAGAFDVAIVQIKDGRQFNVLGVEGNSGLGGIDFDDRLVQHFADEFDFKNNTAIRNNIRAMRRLRTACDSLKKILSTNLEATIEIDTLCDGIDFSSSITRMEFEAISDDLSANTFESVEVLLAKLKLDKSEIDEVFLIGGSTRIPMVTKWHEDFFGTSKMNYTMNAEEIVVTGAAVQVGMLTEERYQEMTVNDIVSLPLFVEDLSKGPWPLQIGLNQKLTLKFKTTDNETTMYFKVFECKKSSIFREYFVVKDIMPDPTGVKMKFHFFLDENGVFSFPSAEFSPSLYGLKPTTSRYCNRIGDSEMEDVLENFNFFAEIDKDNKSKKKVRVELENSILLLEQKLISSGLDESGTLRKYCAAEIEWLENNSHASVSVFKDRKRRIIGEFGRFCAKREFIQYLSHMRSEAEKLSKDSKVKMHRYLDLDRKWIEFKEDNDESAIGERKIALEKRFQEISSKIALEKRFQELSSKIALEKRFQELSSEHRRAEQNELKTLIRTLRTQFNHLSRIHGKLATDKIEQFCDAELAWLSDNTFVSPDAYRKRKIDFINKRDVIFNDFREQHDRAKSELAATCNAVKAAAEKQAITRASGKITYDLNMKCDEYLEWLKKNERASVQDLNDRTRILKQMAKHKRPGLSVAALIVKFETGSNK